MSADLFADWKKEEASVPDVRSGAGGGAYDSLYTSGSVGNEGNAGGRSSSNNNDDFDFDTVGDDDASGLRKQEKPLFELREHGLKISRRKGFTLCCMGVGNGVLAMGSQEGVLLRCTTDATDSNGTIEEIMIEPRVAMSSVFIDPTGAHVLVSMENGANFYLHTGSTRPKKMVKTQGMQFTSVAWDRQSGSPEASKPILIGTASGAVFEAAFDGGKEKAVTKVFQIANQGAIAGIAFEHWQLPSGDRRYYVMLTTSASGKRPTRVFQFVSGGRGGFDAMFQEYTIPEKLRFQEMPGDMTTAELRFYAKQGRERAKGFGVLTGGGVYHGEFVFGLSSAMENVTTGTELLAYPGKPEKSSDSRGSWTPPVSMAVTQYHVVLLFARHIQVVSKLSGVVVMEEALDSRVGNVHDIAVDDTFNTVWIHSSRRILEVVIADEDRGVWKLFLSKAVMGNGDDRDFEQALAVCRNGWERQRVLTAQADKLFDKGKFDRAAVMYAKTTRSFEEVALKFLEIETRDSLLLFLLQKLKAWEVTRRHSRLCCVHGSLNSFWISLMC